MTLTSSGYIKGKPDTTWWLAEILKGEQWRTKKSYYHKWDTWRSWYRNEWPDSQNPVPIFFQMIRTLVPRVYFRNPAVSINPEIASPESIIMSRVLEQLDNKLFRLMKLKEQVKRIVFNSIMFGTGIGEVGYGSQFAPTPDLGSTELSEKDKTTGKLYLEYNDLIRSNMPWFLSVHPERYIVPVGTQDIHSARWSAQLITRSLLDFQDDKRFKHTIDLQSGNNSYEIKRKSGDQIVDPVDVYLVRDKRTRKVMVISRQLTGNNSRTLLFEDDRFLEDGSFPTFPLIQNTDDQFFWGIPDSQELEKLQIDANINRNLIIRHMRASIVKILAEVEGIDIEEAEKLDNDKIRAIVRVKDISAVRELAPTGVPPSLLEVLNMIIGDVERTLGLGVNQFGEYAPGSSDRSATEASIVNQATQIRIDERRDAVADLLVDVVSKLHQVIFSEWKEEQIIDIIGQQDAQFWVRFTPDMLRDGKYQINIDPDTSLPETKMLREQKAVQMYSLLKDDPMINQGALRENLVNAFYGPMYRNLLQPQAPNPMVPGMTPGNPMPLAQLLSRARGHGNPNPKVVRPSTAAVAPLAGVLQG